MNAPNHLRHKPIISVPNYDKIECDYSTESDAKALSIGIAQYDSNEISVKIFRHTGIRWSRQSEELPIHRNLDLTILILNSMLKNNISSSLNEIVESKSDLDLIYKYYESNSKILNIRLLEIRELINKLNK